MFLNYVHCDMRFLSVKINTLPCFLNSLGIAVRYLAIRNTNSTITLIMTLPDGGLPNGTKSCNLTNIVDGLHSFQKVKCNTFHGNFAFSSLQAIHIFTIKYF